MNKIRQPSAIFILVYIILYYLCIIVWSGNERMIVISGNIFQFVAPFIAFFWLIHACLHSTKKNRNFWLLLSLGCFFYVIGQGIWIYNELILGVTPSFPNWSDFFWLTQYVFYLAAFLFRMYYLRHSFSAFRFFLDIVTIMVVATSLSWDFVIHPMLTSINTNTFLFTFVYVGNPIGDLGLLFGALSLLLISDDKIPRKAYFPIVLGFLIKFCSNIIYAYLIVNNSYTTGSYIDPLWSLALLLIGFAGLNAREPVTPSSSQMIHQQKHPFLPYLSVTILLVFTIRKHYQIMEALTYGLTITIVLLIIRIILTLNNNANLIHKQHRLAEDLIEKNLQLEQMNQNISEKEQQLKDVFNNLDAVIWSRDLRTNTSMISIGVEKILGYSRNELQEDPLIWREAVHPEDADKVNEIDFTMSTNKKTNNNLIEFRIIQPNDDIKWIQILRSLIYDEKGQLVKIHAVITDITEHKRAEEKIEFMAYHDELTGLPNRNFYYVCLKKQMEQANGQLHKIAVLFMDLDRFKSVNDTLGHHVGDLLLQAVSIRLKDNLPNSGTICRIGGDEFTIVLPSDSKDVHEGCAQKIIELLERPFYIEGHEIFITPSIGISLFPDHGESVEELTKKADIAMYYAKERGKNNYYVYTSGLDKKNARKIKLENALRRAIGNNELFLHFQPKVELTSGKIVGMEALIRWNHPELGSISPVEFIPIAEDMGLIIQIGEWVLKTACQQNKEWQEIGLPCIPVSVNVSARQLNEHFVATVFRVLQETKLDPGCLELEITESVMQNINESSQILNELKELGIQLSLDDFGTGYSSLSYLKHLPVDSIKIDRSFINDILAHSNGGVMVKTIIDMGRNLNFNVIAEGIENEQQNLFLKENNCYIGQGYYFSPPLPTDKMGTFLGLHRDGSHGF